jgi:hypothetical protein
MIHSIQYVASIPVSLRAALLRYARTTPELKEAQT